jgi:hypothetical protein
MHTAYRKLVAPGLLFLALLGAGCGGKDGDKKTGTPAPGAGGTLTTKFQLSKPVSVAAAVAFAAPRPSFAPWAVSAGVPYGDSGDAGLKSLRYLIQNIYICKKPTDHPPVMDESTVDKANLDTNCIVLYQHKVDGYTHPPGDPIGSHVADDAAYARAHPNDAFIDLLDPASRAAMGASVTILPTQVGTYNYGYVSWYPPYFVTTEVYTGLGTLYSHDGTFSTLPDQNGYMTITNWSPKPLTTPPAQPAVLMHLQGGASFKFQTPFVIAAEDTTAGAKFELNLTFNTGSMATGFVGGGGAGLAYADAPGGRAVQGISMPDLLITPIPLKAGQTVGRETYLLTVTGTTGQPDFRPNPYVDRIELYYINEDPDKKIVGAGTQGMLGPDSIWMAGMLIGIGGIQTQADGSLTLLSPDNYQSKPLITNFKRQTAVGAPATAEIVCAPWVADGLYDCKQGKATASMVGTLVDVSTLGD